MNTLPCDVKGHAIPTDTDGFYCRPQCSVCEAVLPSLLKDLKGVWWEIFEPILEDDEEEKGWIIVTPDTPCGNKHALDTQEALTGLWESCMSGVQSWEQCCDSGKLHKDCCMPAYRIPTK